MKKKIIFTIILIILLLSTLILVSAKPPDRDSKPNPGKAKGHNKEITPTGFWGEWSDYWKINYITNYIGSWGWVGDTNSSGVFNITINDDNGFNGIVDGYYLVSGYIINSTCFDGVVNIDGSWESFYGTINNTMGSWFWRRANGWFIV